MFDYIYLSPAHIRLSPGARPAVVFVVGGPGAGNKAGLQPALLHHMGEPLVQRVPLSRPPRWALPLAGQQIAGFFCVARQARPHATAGPADQRAARLDVGQVAAPDRPARGLD